MEARAPRIVKADEELVALWRKLDFFGTAPWGARAGAEILCDLLPRSRSIWEPACGTGSMAGPFSDYWPSVRSSDIHPFGFGEVLDFLKDEGGEDVDLIATNPPFEHAAEFIRHGLKRARMGVAVLCRTSFIETVDRYPLLFQGAYPMTVFSPFCERLPMTIGPWSHLTWDAKAKDGQGAWKKTSTATSYSWFIFLKDRPPMPVRAIAPGTRDRLWYSDDVQKYGTEVGLPLFTTAAA